MMGRWSFGSPCERLDPMKNLMKSRNEQVRNPRLPLSFKVFAPQWKHMHTHTHQRNREATSYSFMARNVDTMQAEGKVEIAAGTFGNIEAMKARVHVPTDQGTDGPQQSRHAEAYSITQGLLGWFSIALAVVLPTKFSKHISILYVPTFLENL